jgi:histidinol-phosphate/aromatic aminotransferase/cobyric acid decarboxylase-like protein/choline kinase
MVEVQAIILAAGMGKRLKELTKYSTKCMVRVNEVPLANRFLMQLDFLNLKRVVLVVGYKANELREHINTLDIKTPIEYVENTIFDKTNNIYSLYLAKDYLCRDDTLLMESDVIFEDSVLTKLLKNPYPNLALVDKYQGWMEGTVVILEKDNRIKNFITKKYFRYEDIHLYYKTVNIYKFSRNFSQSYYVPFLEAYCKALGYNEYYEQVLKVIAMLDNAPIKALPLNGEKWYEIDDIQDLDIAESIFARNNEDKYKKISNRYGGYWRYPNLLDFCYLVNPHYPPQQMLDEMKASFTQLVTNYPSGLSVNNLLVAKTFGIKRENIIVGNGAAEIIKSLMKYTSGKIGIIRPSFEEYANRMDESNIVEFISLQYTAEDLMLFFEKKNIKTLLLINPDNPSGNFIGNDGLLRLLEWAGKNEINLIVDESFSDFAENSISLLNQEFLEEYPNLIVVKSISKSYGVPGLRLGVLASTDENLMNFLKKDLTIWNINSFGEFFLQIYDKYNDDYNKALRKFYAERKNFTRKLSQIPNLHILPTQANFLMVELLNGLKAEVLCEKLLERNILIKNLNGKKGISGEWIRVAIKTEQENNIFLSLLKSMR